MLQTLKPLAERFNSYMTLIARKRTCDILLSNSDRTLVDIGISRDLLEQGVTAWPWLISEAQSKLPPVKHEKLFDREAIQELQSCSVAERNDLGITRGTINKSFTHGIKKTDSQDTRRTA